MKKIHLIVFALISLFLTSCTDNSGEYGKDLYTNNEIKTAIKTTINMCSDTAISHLCIPNSDTLGFFNYDEGEYRIEVPTAILPIVSSTNNHDSLQLAFNNIASLCGNGIAYYVKNATSSLIINEPDSLLYGEDDEIINFFYRNNYHKFLNTVSGLVQVRMATDSINDVTVDQFYISLLEDYYSEGGAFINIDIYEAIADQMLEGLFSEMRIEEANIRSDVEHRGDKKGIVYKVFNSYDVK